MRHLDMFPKIDTDLVSRTKSGAILTIFTYCILMTLLTSEVYIYFNPREKYDFTLNNNVQHNITASLNIVVFSPCQGLVVEASDILGDQQNLKTVNADIDSGTKCQLQGEFQVAKVDGKISIMTRTNANMSHYIKELRFGRKYQDNMLDDTMMVVQKNQVQYFIGLVPTILENDYLFNNRILITQYTFMSTQNDRRPHGITFKYSVEPISIKISTHKKTFVELVTRLVGILGGIFVTVGIFYRLVNKIQRL